MHTHKHENGPCTQLILSVVATVATVTDYVQLSVLQLLPSSIASILLVGSVPVHWGSIVFLDIGCGQSPLYIINSSNQCEFTLQLYMHIQLISSLQLLHLYCVHWCRGGGG